MMHGIFVYRHCFIKDTQFRVTYGAMGVCCMKYGVLGINHLNSSTQHRLLVDQLYTYIHSYIASWVYICTHICMHISTSKSILNNYYIKGTLKLSIICIATYIQFL